MELNEFLINLKEKYDYSDEMIQLLAKAIPALIKYYGIDHEKEIYGALNECEIHIQRENEDSKEYLNKYFGTNKEWEIPFSGTAFQHTELSMNEGHVQSKSIIYVRTEFLHQYKPFDFTNDSNISSIIHELCHAIKEYGKIKVENGQVVTQTGLIKDTFNYNFNTNTFDEPTSINTGIEEALNSLDEAEIMTIMTGTFHEYGSYKVMTSAARLLMKDKELAKAIRTSQFNGDDDWMQIIGEEKAKLLVENFETWINIMYMSPAAINKNKDSIKEKLTNAQLQIVDIINNYNLLKEAESFKKTREQADEKTIKIIQQSVKSSNQTDDLKTSK